MSNENMKQFQKGCLVTLAQIGLILISYGLIELSMSSQQTIKNELKCMKISDENKICISVFQRNNSLIPLNKGAQAISYLDKFKVLEIQQNIENLKNIYKVSVEEYFQLINNRNNLTLVQDIKLDTQILPIQQLAFLQKAKLSQTAQDMIHIKPSTQIAVFFFLLPTSSIASIKITYPNYNSLNINNKLSILECFGGIVVILLGTYYQFSQNKNSNHQTFLFSLQFSRVNRIFQFLINFGMNNLIYFLTINKIWNRFGLDWIDQLFGFDRILVPMIQANAYQSIISLFPQWLLFSYLVYLVMERYLNCSSFKLTTFSGVFAATIFLLPLRWPQFIFEFSLIVLGLVLSCVLKPLNNKKLPIPVIFSSLNLVLMIFIKIQWSGKGSESNDFMLRYFFCQVFVTNSFCCLFFEQNKKDYEGDRKQIPHEEQTIEQQEDFF